MRYVVWTVRLVIFIAVLFFAYKNVTPVDVVFYDGIRLASVPLIVVILLAFVVGAVFGAVLMLPGRWRRWRESGRLRKDLAKVSGSSASNATSVSAPQGQAVSASGQSPQAGTSPL